MKFKHLVVVVLGDDKSTLQTHCFEDCRILQCSLSLSVLYGGELMTFYSDDVVSISGFVGD